jgi:hypothetical protein
MYALCEGVPYTYALHVCHISVPYMYASYARLTCMPYMYALYGAQAMTPYQRPSLKKKMYAVYVYM